MKVGTKVGMAVGMAVAIAAAVVLLRTTHSRAPVDAAARLRLGVQNNVICALPLIAARQGYFMREGLDVEIVPYPSGKLALEAMFGGEVDVAASADLPIVIAGFERADFAVFGTIAWTERGAWIVARRDRGIAEPKDLRGKRVATQRDSAVHFFLSAFLARHGMGERDVDISFMEAVELPDALAAGRIDAFSMRNPFAARAKAAIGDNAIEMFDPDVYRTTFNLVAWRRSLEKERAVFERFVRALVAAEQLLMRDVDEARRAVVAGLGAHRESEVLADWNDYSFTLTLDQSLFLTLEDQARWALARNPELGGGVPNYLPYVDVRPLMAVHADAVSIIR